MHNMCRVGSKKVINYGHPNSKTCVRNSSSPALPTAIISLQKRSENALKTARDELDRKVRERTAELERRNREIRELAHKTIQAMENDRRALTKELHDSIGGTLAAIMYQLQSRLGNIGTPPPTIELPLEEIISYLAETIQESRRITNQLRPSVLDDFGLVAAIEEHIRDFQLFYPKIKILQKVTRTIEKLSNLPHCQAEYKTATTTSAVIIAVNRVGVTAVA